MKPENHPVGAGRKCQCLGKQGENSSGSTAPSPEPSRSGDKPSWQMGKANGVVSGVLFVLPGTAGTGMPASRGTARELGLQPLQLQLRSSPAGLGETGMYSRQKIREGGIMFSAVISRGGERCKGGFELLPRNSRGSACIPLPIILELNHLHFCCSRDSVRNTHPQGVRGTFLWVDNGSD